MNDEFTVPWMGQQMDVVFMYDDTVRVGMQYEDEGKTCDVILKRIYDNYWEIVTNLIEDGADVGDYVRDDFGLLLDGLIAEREIFNED